MNEILFYYQVLFVFFVSLSLGSFAGMLVYRIPNGKPILSSSERSVCVVCDSPLSLSHNIPLLSYLFLKGKCAFCNAKISPHYFLIELTTALLLTFVFLYFQSGYFDDTLSYYPYVNLVLSNSIEHTFSMIIFAYFLIILSAIDMMTGYLPNKLTYTGMIIAILFSFIDPSISWQESVIGMCAGYGSLWLIAKIFLIWKGVEGMGHGDFKILAMIGAFLGWQSLVFIPLIASIVAISFAVISLLKNKDSNKMTEFPFGQYLSFAAILMVFINSNVVLYLLQ